jgi:hypothetical protein
MSRTGGRKDRPGEDRGTGTTQTPRGIRDPKRAAALGAGTDALPDAEDEHGVDFEETTPSDVEDDPDAMDPVIEGDGADPSFDDGDPSEAARADGYWDVEDAPVGVSGSARHAEILFFLDGDTPSCTTLRATAPRSKHVRERGELLQALGHVIARRQARFLLTEDPADLEPLTAADVARAAKHAKATTGRLVTDTWAELPSGDVVPLRSLLADPDGIRTRFIARTLREHESIHRGADGRVLLEHVLTVEQLTSLVAKRFGKSGNSPATLRRLMLEAAIPADPRAREAAYTEGSDTWTWS